MANRPAEAERARNRLLRRADWRFLLPDPAPASSVCFTRGRLAEAVRHISGGVAHPCHAPAGCDLAVAVQPDQQILRRAASALRPGGILYAEFYLAWPGAAGRVRNRLRAAGFEEISFYLPWPWPSVTSPRFWLPLDSAPAVNYFIDTLPAGPSLVRREGRALLRAGWRLVSRFGHPGLICAVGTRPDRDGPPSCKSPRSATQKPGGLAAILHAGWESWGLGPRPNRFCWLLLTRGERSINKVATLVFADSQPEPKVVVKSARVPEAMASIEREAAVLRYLAARPSGSPRGVPRVLHSQPSVTGALVAETALHGAPLSTRLRRDNFRDLALVATDWLSHLALCSRVPVTSDWRDRVIAPVLADFRSSFGPVASSELLRAVIPALDHLDVPFLVCEHRDFAPWNLLIDRQGELVVLDWESAEIQGLPAADLVYCMSYLAFQLASATGVPEVRAAYRALLAPASAGGRVLAECLARYCDAIGLSPDMLRSLRIFTWMLHSRSESQRLTADVAGSPTDDMLRKSLFLALLQEEAHAWNQG